MSADQLVTDLARATVQKPTGTGLGIASATILTWDSNSLRGTLDYQGTILTDIPVLSGTDALTWQAGDEVILDTWYPPDGHRGKGFGSFMIRGRVVRPGSANAQRIISFLQTELAKTIVDELVEQLLVSPAGQDLAAFVIGQRVHSASVAATVTLTGEETFDDLPGSVGPTVPNVEISDAGIAVVMLSSAIFCHVPVEAGTASGYMGVEVSGATSVAASVDESLLNQGTNPTGTGAGTLYTDAQRATSVRPLAGLNPGTHTFTAKYRNTSSTASAQFGDRSIVVIAL